MFTSCAKVVGNAIEDPALFNLFLIEKVYNNLTKEDLAKYNLLESFNKVLVQEDPINKMSNFKPKTATFIAFKAHIGKYLNYLPAYKDISYFNTYNKGKLICLAKSKQPSFKGYSASQNILPSTYKKKTKKC